MVVVRQRLKKPLFNLHDVIHEYVILTRLSNTIVLEEMYNSLRVLC